MKSRSSWLLVGCWLVAGLLLGCWVAGRLLGWPMVLSTSDFRAQSGFEAIGIAVPPEAAPVRAVAPMAPPDTVPPAPSKAGVVFSHNGAIFSHNRTGVFQHGARFP